MKITVETAGFRELAKDLRKFSDRVAKRVLDTALKSGAEKIAADARSRVPARTGRLRESIAVVKARGNKRGASYQVVAPATGTGKSKAHYGFFIEYGWHPRRGSADKATRRQQRAYNKSFGAVAPRPFLRPAFDENREAVMDAIQQEIDQAVAEIGD